MRIKRFVIIMYVLIGLCVMNAHAKVTASQVRESIQMYIKKEMKLQGGYFLQYDKQKDIIWKLLFEKINKRVRKLKNNVYAAGVDFKTKGDDPDYLNLDFYMKLKDGKLEPYQVKIHIVNSRERYKYRVKSKVHKGKDAGSTLESAPDFTLPDMDGNKVSLSDFHGKVVVINFWATWCPPCRAEIPDFVDLYTAYKDKGFEMIGISLDPDGTKAVDRFMEQTKINYTILIGNMKVSSLYGNITAIPTSFVITQNGGIYKKYVGYRSKDIFEKDIKKLLQ